MGLVRDLVFWLSIGIMFRVVNIDYVVKKNVIYFVEVLILLLVIVMVWIFWIIVKYYWFFNM